MGSWDIASRDSGHRAPHCSVRRGGQRGARQDQGQQRRLPDDQPWLGLAVMVGILLAYKTGAHPNSCDVSIHLGRFRRVRRHADVNFSNTPAYLIGEMVERSRRGALLGVVQEPLRRRRCGLRHQAGGLRPDPRSGTPPGTVTEVIGTFVLVFAILGMIAGSTGDVGYPGSLGSSWCRSSLS